MKKIILLALAVVASAATVTTTAKDKKDKKKKKAQTAVQMLPLVTPADSASYAAGYSATEGLTSYLVNQVGVDTAYMADFVGAFKEAMTMSADPKFTARAAGYQIAEMVSKRIYPRQQQEYNGVEADTLTAAHFNEGFVAALLGDTAVFKSQTAREYFFNKAEQNTAARNAAWDAENKAWLLNNSQQPDVVTLPSGLQYEVLREGDGKKPKATDQVECHYEGTLINGQVFDSSYRRGETATFPLNQVIKGWTEGLQLMQEGAKYRFYIPYTLGYGANGAGQTIPPYATLIFDVELIKVK